MTNQPSRRWRGSAKGNEKKGKTIVGRTAGKKKSEQRRLDTGLIQEETVGREGAGEVKGRKGNRGRILKSEKSREVASDEEN